MKQRKLSKQSPVKPTFYCWSKTNNRGNLFESELELDFFTYLEFEFRNCEFRSQPYSIEYTVNGRKRRYTPDVELVNGNHTTIFEVKHSKVANTEVFFKKASILKELFALAGKDFVVVTEEDIYTGYRVDNLRFLRAAFNMTPPIQTWQKVQEAIPSFEGSIEELQDHIEQLGHDPALVRIAIAHKLIECDLTPHWVDITINW